MLVFSKHKLVFLSVPKTGTTAYQQALAPFASMIISDPPELKHAPVFRYNRFFRPALEKFIGEGLDVIAVMREPVDWLGSWYRYRKRPFMDGKPNSTAELSFDAFVEAYVTGKQPGFARVGSQSKFLEPQRNGTAATHVFRYEDPQALHGFLEERFGHAIATNKVNRSEPEPLDLRPQTLNVLRRKYAPDFELYESIEPNGKYAPVTVPSPVN
ncbi:gamma-glutamyl kinase [Roseovarius sp. LXJ103]|uniref:gamma-glutamyl kinase n=1 Tax=Roseovarius carneus TaxID=2853164 RepID=UPI000D6157E0|nr:gamma-glutamyl kinase [Roseovarius carneus]MBZ8119483.1 gamma-glutamyl kinase [Roseovarius carneus]PWE34886.1 gamma-glutamyl kinase [Pelagicola sp. LXJ1103]